jgi:hypothetical protein
MFMSSRIHRPAALMEALSLALMVDVRHQPALGWIYGVCWRSAGWLNELNTQSAAGGG